MKKINITADEVYPVYGFWEEGQGGFFVEVSEETLDRWKKAKDEYDKVQEELGALYDAALYKRLKERSLNS